MKKSKFYLFVLVAMVIAACSSDEEAGCNFNPSDLSAPRYLEAHAGKVYATFFSGHVARIDTISLAIDGMTSVGRNPEKLVACGNRIFVANSGGLDYPNYDKTVSVVDISTMAEDMKIEVADNPQNILSATDGMLYLVSAGNYIDVPNTLQTINPLTLDVADISSVANMSEICCLEGSLYGLLSEYDANWNQTITYKSYDTATGTAAQNWITDGTNVPSPYKVFTAGTYLCVSSSDYVNNGDVYMFTASGTFHKKIPAGIGPRKAVVAGDKIYILNEGLQNKNNSSLTMYNVKTGEVVQNYFKVINGVGLGDTANDIMIYGGKMYITVSTDNIIWVTDLDAKVIGKIEP